MGKELGSRRHGVGVERVRQSVVEDEGGKEGWKLARCSVLAREEQIRHPIAPWRTDSVAGLWNTLKIDSSLNMMTTAPDNK